MLKDAWDDYKRYAWGQNELKPVSQTGQTGGVYGDSKIGATIIDALDTLYIAGCDDEFQLGRDWIAQNFDFNTVVSIAFLASCMLTCAYEILVDFLEYISLHF